MLTFGDLIDLHVADMKEVGKAPARTKDATLRALKRELGSVRIAHLDRDCLIKFGRKRAKQGAGPATITVDLSFIRTVLAHAAAIHGVDVTIEQVGLARLALARLGLVAHSQERDRRPSDDELARLFAHFDADKRLTIPMTRVVQFAIATAMRQDEIFRVTWDDLTERTKMLLIRDRKDPRHKRGNHQRIPLLDASGFDPMALIAEQRTVRRNSDPRIFPYNGKSAGTAFRRACRDLEIKNLRFHDLRHEGASRLFEAGFTIEQVPLVTGHKDWKMLARYTHLQPESLHNHPTKPRPPTESAPAD